ncbi:MAG: division/cell wall cluster transcriptional repressor MraZ [Candidatus Aminicenantales bacterium]
MGNSLIGSYTAKFDRSGRIKIPEKFRVAIEEEYGKELFITSLTDEAVQIYPLSVWLKLTDITTEGALHLKPTVRKFMLRVNRKGIKYQIDSKGRVLINQSLRERAKLNDEVEIIGLSNHLEIWNKDVLDETLEEKPLTSEDFESISELLPQEKIK